MLDDNQHLLLLLLPLQHQPHHINPQLTSAVCPSLVPRSEINREKYIIHPHYLYLRPRLRIKTSSVTTYFLLTPLCMTCSVSGVDGWVILYPTSSAKSVSIPFHSINPPQANHKTNTKKMCKFSYLRPSDLPFSLWPSFIPPLCYCCPKMGTIFSTLFYLSSSKQRKAISRFQAFSHRYLLSPLELAYKIELIRSWLEYDSIINFW